MLYTVQMHQPRVKAPTNVTCSVLWQPWLCFTLIGRVGLEKNDVSSHSGTSTHHGSTGLETKQRQTTHKQRLRGLPPHKVQSIVAPRAVIHPGTMSHRALTSKPLDLSPRCDLEVPEQHPVWRLPHARPQRADAVENRCQHTRGAVGLRERGQRPGARRGLTGPHHGDPAWVDGSAIDTLHRELCISSLREHVQGRLRHVRVRVLGALGGCAVAAKETLRGGDVHHEAPDRPAGAREHRHELLQQDERRGGVHGEHLQELARGDA
mmetsp:Transcript_49462/g.125658  ORF Transcript_49462/g.125658 Transcript_49462/m.125658 type:complete len:265 (-) Transcript_49462:1616-2410(-)